MKHPSGIQVPRAALNLFTIWLLSCGIAFSQETTVLPQEFPDGFKLVKPVAFYNPGNLFELINGQAVFYLSYGFKKLDHAFYERNSVTYTVDIYELADRLSAFGSYRQQKEDDADALPAGCEGFLTEHLAAFYQDIYYIEIIPAGSSQGSDVENMRLLAGYVVQKLPGIKSLPPELELFPQEGLIKGSERYSGENLLSYSFMGRGLVARYTQKQDGKEYRVFIAFADSVQDVPRIVSEFGQKLENASPIKTSDSLEGLTGDMPYRGKAMLFGFGITVFGVISFSNIEEVKKIMVMVHQNIQ